MSAFDKERIALAKSRQEKDWTVLAKAKAKGLANRAKIKAEQYKKNCEAKNLEIARLVAGKTA